MKTTFIIVLSIVLLAPGCQNKTNFRYSEFFSDESSKLLSIRESLHAKGDIRSGLNGVHINFPLRSDDESMASKMLVGLLINIVLTEAQVKKIECSIGNKLLDPIDVKKSKNNNDLSMYSFSFAVDAELFLSNEMRISLNGSDQVIINHLLLDQWKVLVYQKALALDQSEIKDSILTAWFLPTERVVRMVTPDEWDVMQ